jgi:transcriptional regulator with XRE-family HTH domain
MAKARVERQLRRRYGSDRKQRLAAADKIGKSEKTVTRWLRGESEPSIWDALNFIASTENMELARAMLEPFGFTIARTADVEALNTLRTAEQLQPILQESLPGLKTLLQVWEELRCPNEKKKGSISSKPPGT